MQIKHDPSGSYSLGPSGEIIIYIMNYKIIGWHFGTQPTVDYKIQSLAHPTKVVGETHTRNQDPDQTTNPRCITWNVTIPAGLSASTSFFAPVLKI